MKGLLLAALMLCIGLLTACEKSGSRSLIGKWSVVSDSTIISGGTTSYNVYHANDADYFVFKAGILYTKEASQLDTFLYKIISSNTMSLSQIGITINAAPETGVYTFTGNNVRIYITPNFLNPGFTYRRIINLRR